MLLFQGEMLCYTSEWDGSPQVLFRQRGECHSIMPRCFYACANAFDCMNLLALFVSLFTICLQEGNAYLMCVCVCMRASFESRSRWIIQCVDPVCSSSYLVMRRLETTKSQASPLISQTLAFTGSCVCVYIRGQEHTLPVHVCNALQVCCTWCAFLSLMQWCTKLSFAFGYFFAICFWP